MHLSTRRNLTGRTARDGAGYAAAFAAPGVAIAASGALSGAALAVALLLGVFVVAVASYFTSARALVERSEHETPAPRATATAAASGAC